MTYWFNQFKGRCYRNYYLNEFNSLETNAYDVLHFVGKLWERVQD